jgi:hypothetical protein
MNRAFGVWTFIIVASLLTALPTSGQSVTPKETRDLHMGYPFWADGLATVTRTLSSPLSANSDF